MTTTTATTTAPVDWDSPLWGTGVVHLSTGGGIDAERTEDQ